MQDMLEKIQSEQVLNHTEVTETTAHQEEILTAPILCCYVNSTSRLQVGRLSHLPEGEWEHIFFPGQHFMFEAPPEADLIVYKSPSLSLTVPDHIRCETLQVPSG